MTRKLTMAASLLALLLAACGGDDESTGNADATSESRGGADSDFHACSLFTGAELGEILGVEMTDGRDYLATAPGATNCTWEGEVAVFVEVLLEGGQDWYDAIHVPDAAVGEIEEVDGVGDIAVWDTFLGTLDVVEGDRFVSVQPLVSFTDLDGREAAIEIAQLVLERLP